MSSRSGVDCLNGLTERYAAIFGEEYSDLYRENIAGKRLAHNMTIEEFRANPVIAGFGRETPPDVGSIETLAFPSEDGSELRLKIYYPRGYDKHSDEHTSGLPCYFDVHGGGFVIGKPDDDRTFCQNVTSQIGCISIAVDYRLAPEHKFPIPIHDCRDGFKYISQPEVAAHLGIDPNRIAVGGFSAGGHIAAQICLIARDEDWKYKPCFQLLVVPVCDAGALDEKLEVRKDCPYESWMEHHNCPFLSHARMSWFYKHFLPAPITTKLLTSPLLSPLRSKSLANLPPALVAPADVDVLRDEGIAYAKRLRDENDSFTQLWLARRVPHPFAHQPAATPVAVQFRNLACRRLAQAFAGDLRGKEWISNL